MGVLRAPLVVSWCVMVMKGRYGKNPGGSSTGILITQNLKVCFVIIDYRIVVEEETLASMTHTCIVLVQEN